MARGVLTNFVDVADDGEEPREKMSGWEPSGFRKQGVFKSAVCWLHVCCVR